MNDRTIKTAAFLFGAGVIIGAGIIDIKRTRAKGRSDREKILDEMGLDVAAIHRATDVVNGQIERGEIRDWETLRQRVVDEVAFQKIAIREADKA